MNKKIKNTLIAGAMASATFASVPAIAGGFADSLKVEGRLTIDAKANTNTEPKSVDTNISNAEIRMSLALHEGLKAVVGLELAKALNNSVDEDDIAEMLEEAYVEISANGKAMISVGKQQIPFGEQLAEMAIPENDQRFDLVNETGLLAIVVEIPKESLGIVKQAIDKLEISVFETGANDFKIAEKKGGSFRATKALSEKMRATVSGLMKQTDGDNEYRGAVSVAYETDSGWTIYAEGQVLRNNAKYPDADFVGTVGAKKDIGPGTLVLQASAVDQHGEEIGASYHLPVGQAVTLSPEIRYNTKKEETTAAVRMTIKGQKTFKKLMGQMPKK